MATNDTAAAAAATSDADSGVLLSLNVRTIDQRTFPISVRSGASVPQLKAAVEVETGVTLARQRLIFRGRVLKNDQKIAAYSLEDGHTLHLVVRADPSAAPSPSTPTSASVPAAPATPSSANTGRMWSRSRDSVFMPDSPVLRIPFREWRGRDNDEPDPALSGPQQGNRVVMGATITVPEGADVNMPFLSSMIANIVTSVQGNVAGGEPGELERSMRRVNWPDELRPSNWQRIRSAGRSRRDRGGSGASSSRGGDGSTRSSRGGATTTAAAPAASAGQPGDEQARLPSHSDRQASLRARAALRLDNIQEALGNAEFDFRGIEHAQVDAAGNSDAAAFQVQLDQFAALLQQFAPRMQLLPVALSDRDRLQDQTLESQFPLARPIVRAIETLQTIGESADLLSRTARHLFLRQSSRTIGEFNRYDDIRRSRAAIAAARSAARSAAASASAAGDRVAGTSSATPAAPTPVAAAASAMPPAARDQGDQAMAPGVVLPSLLQQLLGGSRGFPVDLTGGTTTPLNAPPATGSGAAGPARASGPRRLAFGGMGLPLASVVFPISLSGVANGATTWNFADLVSRLVGEVPSSTLYGVLTGDPMSVHQAMAHVGFALVSGVDVPPVTRANIRTWSSNFANELRQQLRAHGVPSAALTELDSAHRSSFVDDLVRPIEPFVPDLVDYLFRATSASRAAAFGTRSAEFLRTMSRQFVSSLGDSVGGDTERLGRVLRQLLVCLGMQENLAGFVVSSFLGWASAPREDSRAAASGSASRRRQRSTAAAAAEPSVKRQRRP